MPTVKRTIKDSVFTYLFRHPEYTLKLYLTLHPEDTDVTEADIKLVTLENVITVGQYNDLGIQVRGKLIILVEAQSTFSVNIALRMLLYLAATYKEYVEEHSLDLYGTKPVRIPRPELYVIYTGSKADVPDAIHLSDLYDGAGDAEVALSVLRANGTGDIVDQYVRFCKISDEEREKHGNTEDAITNILRRCKEEGILVTFLASREKEVHDIMVTLFDEEWIAKMHDRSVREEGREKGLKEEFLATVKALFDAGQSIGFMTKITRRSEDEVKEALSSMNLSMPS